MSSEGLELSYEELRRQTAAGAATAAAAGAAAGVAAAAGTTVAAAADATAGTAAAAGATLGAKRTANGCEPHVFFLMRTLPFSRGLAGNFEYNGVAVVFKLALKTCDRTSPGQATDAVACGCAGGSQRSVDEIYCVESSAAVTLTDAGRENDGDVGNAFRHAGRQWPGRRQEVLCPCGRVQLVVGSCRRHGSRKSIAVLVT